MVGARPGGVHPRGAILPVVLRLKANLHASADFSLAPTSDPGENAGPEADHGDEHPDGCESGGFLNKNTDHVDLPRT